VFDRRPSLLGNRKLNTLMHTWDSSTVGSDMLTTPVLLVTIAANSRKASVDCIATNSSVTYTGCGSVTNNKTRVWIGYRIHSLWRLQLQQITITENILTLALVAS
jgi:hypothetical protein